MTLVEIEFDNFDVDKLFDLFLSLPSSLRPTHFCDDETDTSRRRSVNDKKERSTFFKGRTTGFFLFGPNLNCLVTLPSGKSFRISCSIGGTSEFSKVFLTHMAAKQVTFGFACVREEKEQRNRLTITQGKNTIECWVGQDTRKYIPGFYWLTLLPERLAEQHGLSLSSVKEAALEHIELKEHQHLFRFYEGPLDWCSTAKVTKLISSQPGVFSADKVRQDANTAKNYLELSAVLRNWK